MRAGVVGLVVGLALGGCAEAASEPPSPDSGPEARDAAGPRDAGRGLDAGGGSADAGPGDAGPDVAAPPVDAGPPSPAPGLSMLTQIEHPTAGPHLGELAVSGDTLYVANSWDVFGVYAREPDGELGLTMSRPDDAGMVRCTTLTVHEASRTLYCSSDESTEVRAYDLTDPEHPVLRDADAVSLPWLGVRDLHVAGDVLYLAAFDQGLWVAPIAADGSLGEVVRTAVEGNIHFVGGSERPVALTADPELLVLEGRGAETSIAARVVLPGTAQDVSVRDGRAAVALGSAGAAVIDLDAAPPAVVHTVIPQAVATGADLDGDALAVTTLTGAYLYDLAGSPPRLAGFVPSGDRRGFGRGVMLSGRFVGGQLVTSDWIFVERFAVDLAGDVLMLDVPRGIYVGPGAEVVVPLRNEGELPFDVAVAAGDTVELGTVGAGETLRLALAADAVAALPVEPSRGTRRLRAGVIPRGGALQLFDLDVLVRDDAATAPADRPAPGAPFPDVVASDPMGVVVSVPSPAQRTRAIFFARDCAAMWPVLQDAAYLGRRGALDGGAMPFLLTESPFVDDGYAAMWALSGTATGHFGYLAPPEVWERNGSMDLYERRFKIRELRGAASHPTDYLIDETGRVEAVEIYYRGAHPLR